ncbi:uncharacterized protein [Amphiura filiformis]|uniref:uncharacterized protein isoform X1 n=1 Tax=Amphiura filiformis TaxID=82378 RepID=UPI003B211881
MGIVVSVIIDVVVSAAAAAVEAAAEAAAAAAAEAAEVAAETAAEAAAEAEAEGAAEAAAEAEAEATAEGAGEAAKITAKVLRALAKLSKLTKEFFAIDAVFKSAEKILKAAFGGGSPKVDELNKLIKVLVEMKNKMTTITEWLHDHKEDTVKLDGINVSVDSGVLAKFMTPLSTGVGVLQHLAKQVSQLNDKNQPITDELISSVRRSLLKVADTFDSLATYMPEKSTHVPVLSSFPISTDEVRDWKRTLGVDTPLTPKLPFGPGPVIIDGGMSAGM